MLKVLMMSLLLLLRGLKLKLMSMMRFDLDFDRKVEFQDLGLKVLSKVLNSNSLLKEIRDVGL